jgi:hypothetical protein
MQAGFCCVAIGSIWNVVRKGKSIPDVDILPRGSRRVDLVPESDIWPRPNLMRTVYAFGRILEDRGTGVAVVILAPETQGNRLGLDYPNTSLSAHFGAPRRGATL